MRIALATRCTSLVFLGGVLACLLSGSAAADPIVIEMKSMFAGRWDGNLSFSDADGKACRIDVYYYNVDDEQVSVVFLLSDGSEEGRITFARLFPEMGIPLQCQRYVGNGADLDEAMKNLELQVQQLVGNDLRLAVTRADPEGAPRFTLRYGQPAAESIAVGMKSMFAGRWDGNLSFRSVDGKDCRIDVYYYDVNPEQVSVVFELSDGSEEGHISHAKLFPDMGIPLQCQRYVGYGADLDAAMADLEQGVQQLVGNRLQLAVDHEGPEGAPRFTLSHRQD